MDQVNIKNLLRFKKRADDAYFNSDSPIITDEQYDALCQQISKQYTCLEVGCLPRSDKIQLPIYMGSLTKHNDNKSINNFLDKFNHDLFVLQEKLDGVSCLYTCQDDKIQLYTRGNGTIGTDITHLINYGLKIPHNIRNIMVRGELIMNKTIFEEKFSQKFKNIRNMVSGQLSKKKSDQIIISNLDFVAYEVIQPHKQQQQSMVEQLKLLEKYNFKVVHNRIVNRGYLDQEILMDYLVRRKRKSFYEIDGLVITINGEYERNVSDNPKYSFAFKTQGEVVEATVDHVKWNLSKSGKYKPQIFIKPVNLSGVTISSLTGFNAKFIVDNQIVCGSILSITRSGDVIPHILGVIKNGNCPLELPQNSKWNSVDLYHNFQETPDEVVIKQMVYFFTSLKCLNCKDKTIQKFYNSGYTSIESLIQAQPEDLSKIPGVGNKVAIKILTSIRDNIRDASIHELLAALNSFGEGIGLKKIQNIDISNPYKTLVPGLSEATIKEKILPVWDDSLNHVKNIKKMVGIDPEVIEQKNTDLIVNEGPFKDKIFVFTGFRDTLLERQLIDLGGKVTSAISKKTTDLIVASDHNLKTSTKLLKARELGIKITIKFDLIKQVKTLQEVVKQPEIEYDDYGSSEEE